MPAGQASTVMRRPRGLLAAIAIVCACAALPPVCELTVRNAHALAFDGRGLVLFGGADEARVSGETWLYRRGAWRLASAAGPPPRTFPAFAYDAARGEAVLFGGHRVLFGDRFRDQNVLADTWIWNGRRWREARVAPAPEARTEAAAAYDSARRRIVLFGGYTIRQGERERLGDTWEWDGERWSRAATTGPAARNGAAMAYDAARKRTVLFGGRGATNDTWEWNGTAWRQVATNDVPGRFNSVMAYDEERGVVVRFGGWNGKQRTNDTWLLAGATWRLASESGPPPRNHAALAWDPLRRTAVLFGGHDGDHVFGDAWEWNGTAWRRLRDAAPRQRVENQH
jgi:hypothetical protein